MDKIAAIFKMFGVKKWDSTEDGCFLTSRYGGQKLYCCFEMDEQEVNQLDTAFLRRVLDNLPALDTTAHQAIQKAVPDEDAAELTLTDMFIRPDETVLLGYDTGDSQEGELYLFVKFDKDLKPAPELIYEIY